MISTKEDIDQVIWSCEFRTKELTRQAATLKLVLLTLFSFTDTDSREDCPSQTTIAKRANVSRKTVVLALKRLEELGVIRKTKISGRLSFHYEFVLSELLKRCPDSDRNSQFGGKVKP